MATQPEGIMERPRFGPSDSLASMFRTCARDPTEAISQRLRRMLQTFMQHRNNAGAERSLSNELAVKCAYKAGALYYRILEAITNQEKTTLRFNNISDILEHDVFQRSLVVCCLEIVIFLHRLPGEFPLVLQIFNLSPYHFYKVIELVLRAEEGLPSGVVRHLSRVEQQVLESLAWTRDSLLWHSVRANQGYLPACRQVIKHFEDPVSTSQDNTNSANQLGVVSSLPVTVHDRYSTPSAGAQMTFDLSRASPAGQAHTSSVFVPGQRVVAMAAATVSTTSGQILTIPVQLCLSLVPNRVPSQQQQPRTTEEPSGLTPVSRPPRTSSLYLFLRKVYELMSRRLTDLCLKLGIADELRVKIWTCFEHSLVNCTGLMLDRHLDQLLMCAIYVMAKVTKVDMPFKRIMKCYKTQPHGSNSVCKNVLISARDIGNSPAGTNSENSGAGELVRLLQVIMLHGAGSQNAPDQQERGNLIHFYNRVYTKQMRHFVLPFSPTFRATDGSEPSPLTPYPRLQRECLRRHRLTSDTPLFISPHNNASTSSSSSSSSSSSPATPTLSYYFNRSPSVRLHEINKMIRTGKTPSRRYCVTLLREEEQKEAREEGDGPPVKRPRHEGPSAWQRRLRNVVSERKAGTRDRTRLTCITADMGRE